MEDPLVTYRELAPSPALRGYVRAFFSCTPGAPRRARRPVLCEVAILREGPFCSPFLADARASLVLNLGGVCELGVGWTFGAPVEARAIGAFRRVAGPAPTCCAEMVGAYFEPGATAALLGVPPSKLIDLIVDLDDLWGPSATRLAMQAAELDEAERIDRLEAVLLERLQCGTEICSAVNAVGLARWARSNPAGMTVRRLADAAGVSRQHLARLFRETIGVSPKRYCRLARFQAGLVYAGAGSRVPWAQVAAELGYADQSHMIAEFRELSGLTPQTLAGRRWFHPFILEARVLRRLSALTANEVRSRDGFGGKQRADTAPITTPLSRRQI